MKNNEYRLKYHLMPLEGTIADPNGMCQIEDTFHIFYLNDPQAFKTKGRVPCIWRHYSTQDFISFVQEPIALLPDSRYDRDGVYSGSSFYEKGKLYLFYTGNVRHQGNYDYIMVGREQNVLMVQSADYIHFDDKQLLMTNADFPQDMTKHVRDPYVFYQDQYYMFLGARDIHDQGMILAYESKDKKEWKFIQRIKTEEKLGYMWECPDYFELSQQQILVCCPQGIKQHEYENNHQCGYFILNGDFRNNYQLERFQSFDEGFDFYAARTFLSQDKRRILVGWMGIPDCPYKNPTIQYNWNDALILPRELTFKDNQIYQYPIRETKNLRTKHLYKELVEKEIYYYQSHACQIHLEITSQEFQIDLRKDLQLRYDGKILTLSLQESGYGRDKRCVKINEISEIDIFSDVSSLEIFINHGQKVMTTRVYDSYHDTKIKVSCPMTMDYYELKPYNIIEKKETKI